MDKLKDLNISRVGEKTDLLLEGRTEILNATAATLTVTPDDSGKTIVLSRAAGIAITLPYPEVGLNYKFVVITSASTGSYVFTASSLTDNSLLFRGGVSLVDSDTSDAHTYTVADVANDNVIELNGTTQGGLIGTWLKLKCLVAGKWEVSGVIRGSGTVATPFEVNYTTTAAPTTTS